MKYLDLVKTIKYPIFSLQDLRLLHLNIYPYQLSNWVKKEYLIKLKNGLFLFSDKKDDVKMETIAFNMYQPSYVSMEWVLAKYGLIPEMTYSCTSVTTKTTRSFKNKFGIFTFRHIKKSMFFGYEKVEKDGQIYLIAELEKALVDYIYLNASKIRNKDDVISLRFNEDVLSGLNKIKLKEYAKATGSKKTLEIIKIIC